MRWPRRYCLLRRTPLHRRHARQPAAPLTRNRPPTEESATSLIQNTPIKHATSTAWGQPDRRSGSQSILYRELRSVNAATNRCAALFAIALSRHPSHVCVKCDVGIPRYAPLSVWGCACAQASHHVHTGSTIRFVTSNNLIALMDFIICIHMYKYTKQN